MERNPSGAGCGASRRTFDPLPLSRAADGEPRRVGVEIEFGGLPESRAAAVIRSAAGGAASEADPGVWQIDTPDFGRCDVYLDTRFRDDVARIAGPGAVDLARLVIPVELVTQPFDPARLGHLDSVVEALREAGATGSRQGILLGFGVHLNVEIAEPSPAHLWRVLTAYALMEAQLRETAGVDISRRVLPFVQPYPDALLDALAAREPERVEDLAETYLAHAPTRNHGLDMLPVFAHLAPEVVEGRLRDGTETKPRPAYHFRMPDCRIDEPRWSLGAPWSLWLAVEQLAAEAHLFERLRHERGAWARRPALLRAPWSSRVRNILDLSRTEALA